MVSFGVGLGEAFFRRFGDAVGVGDAFVFDLARGLGVGEIFFLVILRCLRGVGVGVGWKIFLILSPNDCSAASATRESVQTAAIARTTRQPILMIRSGGQFLQNRFVHPDATLEIFDRKILVRRMRAAVRQSQPAQQRFGAENISKIGNDRDAATLANQSHVVIEGFVKRALGGFAEFRIRIGQIPRTVVPRVHFQGHAGRQIFLQMFFGELEDGLRFLIRHETKGEFRKCEGSARTVFVPCP